MAEQTDVMPLDVIPTNCNSKPGNEVNNKATRQRGVTITYKRKVTMALGGFLNLVERLDYEQWSAIMDTEFGGILAVRTRLVPERLARRCPCHIRLIDGPTEISEGGGPPVGSMDDVIIERGGHGHEFIIDFIIYAISTCIVANANGTCHFRMLKYLCSVNEIRNYNWCAYVNKCLNNALIEWKRDKSKFFTGPLLSLMNKP
ncbi:hypothetical protein Cgig2_027890 [Carnegiea gigantea]|uniref:Aminotransferase-like plant mobile domain-containing protein n=1 Tax=Carnegiea gigantea TaxID=171969 RepID=A0A9Q1KN16_9CARY|nr:hypothetical protein Cgig2_027890 [Carnegiea gigantea]